MKPGPWLELVINPFMLLHCCGRLILSVLGTQTVGVTITVKKGEDKYKLGENIANKD